MPIKIENLNTKGEGEKELESTGAKSRILENSEEIGNQIILLAKTSNEISIVCSLGGMQGIYDNDKFFDTYKKLLDKYKRGEHNGIRWITSIVGVKLEKDDIELIKTFLDLGMQIRHVKNLSIMNFAVSDKMLNATIEKLEGGKMVQNLLTSHDPNYIHHFYSVFEDLWDNGIDAADRIEDIEGGIEIADIEVIQNPKTAITKAWRLVKSAKQENLVLFSSIKAFERQIQIGLLELLKEVAVKNNVKVRILLPKSPGNSSNNHIVDQALKEFANIYPHQLDLRLVEESIPIRITIAVIDRKECMIVETKDDSKDDSFHAAGSSVYSNSKTIALSYASIFESLWIQTETYEKLKAYSKMQREFINTAAHELRTPIQPILGIGEVLRFGAKQDIIGGKKKLNESLDIILRNARRLKDLADNILNVSLIESRSLRLEKELFNLNDIIVDNIKMAKRQFLIIDNGSSLKIIYDHESETEADMYVEADRYRISQVVYNLLNNAIKFTNEGSITISVKRRDDTTKNNKVIVSVKDTGKGIDSEILPRLFTRFATKSFAGTGLGLFVSKHIIEAHDGEIWAENNPDGRGATFAFSLPILSNR
ncbi:MAG TPA: HAMP domain-containing sensor histidine kinase [Nitrososphaeraceae archaeon]